MVDEEKFKELPHPEKLKVLMKEAREKKDIWLMLLINDEVKKLSREKTRGTQDIPSCESKNHLCID